MFLAHPVTRSKNHLASLDPIFASFRHPNLASVSPRRKHLSETRQETRFVGASVFEDL